MTQQTLERPVETAPTETVERVYPPLTAQDRCDAPTWLPVDGVKTRVSCGAQAFIRVVMPSGLDLLFCGHHLGEQTVGKNAAGTKAQKDADTRQALDALGAEFRSNYGAINLKPTPSD